MALLYLCQDDRKQDVIQQLLHRAHKSSPQSVVLYFQNHSQSIVETSSNSGQASLLNGFTTPPSIPTQQTLHLSVLKMSVDHTSLPVPHSVLEDEVRFLNAALGPLGIKELSRVHPAVVGMGTDVMNSFLWVTGINNKGERLKDGSGNAIHLALKAKGMFPFKWCDCDGIRTLHGFHVGRRVVTWQPCESFPD